jgi:hypothetical protein
MPKSIDRNEVQRLINQGAQIVDSNFINRAGKNLSVTRKRELEKAKAILQKRRRSTNKGREDEVLPRGMYFP